MAALPAECKTTDDFIKSHTEIVSPDDRPILEECPVCLDTYVNESAARITLPGCGHMIGLSCLTAILEDKTDLDKKCPLCRTLWMKALPPVLSSGPRPRHPFDPHTFPPVFPTITSEELDPAASYQRGQRIMAMLNARHSASETATRHRLSSGMGALPPTPAFHFLHGRYMNNDSDSDSDPLASYERISRDIADVRSRARNTQLSRRQRREEANAREQNANGTDNAPDLQRPSIQQGDAPHHSFWFNERSGTATGDGERRYSPPMTPQIEALITRNWRNAQQNDNEEEHSGFRVISDGESPPPENTASSSLGQEARIRENMNTIATAQREMRQTRREQELRDWERRLSNRERELRAREQAMTRRESRAAQRESAVEESSSTRQRNLREMEQLVKRMQDEERLRTNRERE